MGRASVAATALFVALAVAPSVAKPWVEARRPWLRTEGLYYLDSTSDVASDIAFVITRDGRAIPPKSNDPAAPTLQGLHVDGTRFRFAARSVSMKRVSFRTVTVRGVSYRFSGRVGFEKVESIDDVPYVLGTLSTIRNGKTFTRKVRFVHAVVL